MISFELLIELLHISSMDTCKLLGKCRCSWMMAALLQFENIVENVESPILLALL